jgi:hypothetical protein
MRKMTMAGLAIVVALTFSVITASGAAAEEFLASKTGKLKGKALNTQKFKAGGLATVECTSASPTGEVTEDKSVEQSISMAYSGCSVAAGSASVGEADYIFYIPKSVSTADESSKPMIIKAEALGIECEVEIQSGQSLGGSSGEIEYVNKSGHIEVKNKITKISSRVLKSNSESLCGKVGSESSSGTYEGNDEVELEGGTLEVSSGSHCGDIVMRPHMLKAAFPFNYNSPPNTPLKEKTEYTENFELSLLPSDEEFTVTEVMVNPEVEFKKEPPGGTKTSCATKPNMKEGAITQCEIRVKLKTGNKGEKYKAVITMKYAEVNGPNTCIRKGQIEGNT